MSGGIEDHGCKDSNEVPQTFARRETTHFEQFEKCTGQRTGLLPDDLSDETDLAASEINQNLVFKLRDRERQLLAKIDEALSRMEGVRHGTFGTCGDCEEPIEPRRLEKRAQSRPCA